MVNINRFFKNSLYLALYSVQFLLLVFLFPSLEFPDSLTHLKDLFSNSNKMSRLYLQLLKNIASSFGYDSYNLDAISINSQNMYFSFKPFFNIPKDFDLSIIYSLKFINLMFVLIFIVAYLVFFTKKQDHRLRIAALLYFVHPTIIYISTGLTPDFLVYMIQPLLLYLLVYNKKILYIFITVLFFIFIDKSIFTNIVLIGFVILFQSHKITKTHIKLIFVLFLIMLGIAKLLLELNLNILLDSPYYQLQMLGLILTNYGRLLTKIVNFSMSSLCFWGIGNYYTFLPFYLIWFTFIGYLIMKAYKITENKNLILSTILTIATVIIILPPYSHIRFFTFFIMIIFYLLSQYLNGKQTVIFISVFIIHNIILSLYIAGVTPI